MLVYHILLTTIYGKIKNSPIETTNLKYQPLSGMINLIDLILHQIFKSISLGQLLDILPRYFIFL